MKKPSEYAQAAIENWRISETTRMSQAAVRVIASEAVAKAIDDAFKEAALIVSGLVDGRIRYEHKERMAAAILAHAQQT